MCRMGRSPSATAASSMASATREARLILSRDSHFHRQGRSPFRSPFVLISVVMAFSCSKSTVVGAITVATPVDTYVPGDSLVAEWVYEPAEGGGTTGDLNAFTINLQYCGKDGSDCNADSGACGDEYVSLCPKEDGLCMDSDGMYDIVIPEDAEAGKYGILVALASAPGTIFGCSNSFDVSADPDDTSSATAGAPTLEAIAPYYLEVGEAFTARWLYDNGAGDSEGTFEIDLYSCADAACDDGGCGEFSASLCGTGGCYDPGTGDYDVRIPDTQALGTYKLQVKNMDDATTHCSDDMFSVIEQGGDAPTTPPGQSPYGTPAPAVNGTPSPVLASTAKPVTPSPSTASSSSSDATPGSPGTPPSPVPSKSDCNTGAELSFVYSVEEDTGLPLVTVAHASDDRSEAGCLTLTDLWDWVSSQPNDVPTGLLYTVDPTTGVEDTSLTATPTGTWLLKTSVEVTNGVTFQIMGTSNVGGDCDELKISSSKSSWYRVMGYGGNIDIYDTVVRSWDESTLQERIFEASWSGKDERSFIACVSEVEDPGETCTGVAQNDMGECRMDIVKSNISYLGYDATESYGITWKEHAGHFIFEIPHVDKGDSTMRPNSQVRGLCDDLSNVDTIFESVRVYGDLKDSEVHNLWYGHYSFGHLGGVLTKNSVHENHVYGLDPHDDSDYLTIEGNICYNNVNHGIIASKRCDHLLIKDNICYNNGGSGIMLHKSCDDSEVTGNNCTSNYDAGLSLVETLRTTIRDNYFEDNRWGVRLTTGSSNNTFDSNIVVESTYSDLYAYEGPSEEVAEVYPYTGVNVNNVFSNNEVRYIAKSVVDIENSDQTSIVDNDFIGDVENAGMVFLNSTETHVLGNTGDIASGLTDDVTDSCFTEESSREPVCT